MIIRYLILAFFLFISFVSRAQTGSIRVTVFDDTTGEPMIGSSVVIAGTTTGGATDLDGKVAIEGLEPGNYNIQVSYISYQPQTIQGVQVKANEATPLSVRLKEESVGLQEVVVEAKALQNSENALLTVQKRSTKVLDAISSEQFSRTGDGDAAAAVKRVTGVTIEGGKYVFVRGLGDRYSRTELNGATIPGLDPNRNSVQLDLFPSNLIDNLIVYKTFSPDLTGEFTGGLVNVSTKDFPDRFTFQISGAVGYNPQANLRNDFLTYEGSNTDWLGFGKDARELPAAIADLSQTDFPQPVRNQYQRLDQITKSFTNRQFGPSTKNSFLDHSLSVSVGNQKQIFGKQFGYIAALSYSKDHEFYDNGFTGRWSGVGAGITSLDANATFLLNDARSQEVVTWGALLNNSLKLNNFNKISLNLMHNQSGTSQTRSLSGLWNGRTNEINPNEIYQTRTLAYLQRGLSTAQLKGQHNLPGLRNAEIAWISSYTLSTQDEPDLRFFSNYISILPDGDSLVNVASNVGRPSRYFRDMQEYNWDNKLDITVPLQVWRGYEAKLKFGGAYTQKDREYREYRYEYFPNTANYNGSIEAFFSDANLGLVENNRLGMYLANLTETRNNYDADQQVYAGYIMMEAPVTPKLKLTGGARFESTNINLVAFNDSTGNLKTQDILPALSATYEVIKDMNIRLSYGRTLARPTFREFAPLATFDFQGDFIQLGNPNLKRTLIDNYDIRWEMYPRPGEYLSVSGFYKNFTDPIENTLNPDAGNPEYKYENVGQATIAGVELEVRKDLDFISEALKNFKIGANVTLIRSRVNLEEEELFARRQFDPEAKDYRQLYAQSPYIINGSLSYGNMVGTGITLSYNVFGERLSLVSTNLPYVYEQPRPEMNLSMQQKFNDHWSIRLQARNLLNPAYRQTMEFFDKEYTFQEYRLGRSFSLSVTYLLN